MKTFGRLLSVLRPNAGFNERLEQELNRTRLNRYHTYIRGESDLCSIQPPRNGV
jgi:hypothetical protein